MEQFTFVPEGVKDCTVRAWLHPEMTEAKQKRYPAMLICPGGGYRYVSQREGEPVAQQYYRAGFNTFILTYSVEDRARGFEPLRQLAAAIAHLRRNAEQMGIDPDRVVVCGFSAGGHLAASLGVLHNDDTFLSAFPQTENIRPDALLLSYPVITADQFTHRHSLEFVSGGADPESKEYAYWGLDTHVDSQTPPTFLWHTAADQLVPVENSLRLAGALSAAKVPFELHIFPEGEHGMSVCNREVDTPDTYNGRWVNWSIAWLERQFGLDLGAR